MKNNILICILAVFCILNADPFIKKSDPVTHEIQNKEFYKNIIANIKHGDWLITRGYHISDQIVSTATWSDFSHVVIYDSLKNQVVEAEGQGIHTTPLKEFVDKSHQLVLIRPKWAVSSQVRSEAVKNALDKIGKKYDFLGTVGINDSERWYCSELAVYAYKKWFAPEDKMPLVLLPSEMTDWGSVVYDSGARDRKNEDKQTEVKRPEKWAKPVYLEGVPNLHRITDNLYRSAQPTKEGMKNLKELGIETDINLRSFHSDRDELSNTGISYEHIYMKAWHPEFKEAVRFLQLVTNPKNQPVLFHCQHGADRTGTMCAIYRIAVQGWTKEEALKEMREGGYNYHEIWINLPDWIRDLDVEKLRKEAGI